MHNYQKLFDESYDRVVGHGVAITEKGKKFFALFYDYFFGQSEEIRRKFEHTDMEQQLRVLHKSMYHMIGLEACGGPWCSLPENALLARIT